MPPKNLLQHYNIFNYYNALFFLTLRTHLKKKKSFQHPSPPHILLIFPVYPMPYFGQVKSVKGSVLSPTPFLGPRAQSLFQSQNTVQHTHKTHSKNPIQHNYQFSQSSVDKTLFQFGISYAFAEITITFVPQCCESQEVIMGQIFLLLMH